MKLSPERLAMVTATLAALMDRATEAGASRDTDECRKRLNAVWHAVHLAQETLNTAEKDTRREALAQLEHADA